MTSTPPLLAAQEAEVRRAALFAVGPATDDDPVVGDEDLFRWLHDPDAGVRQGCHDALTSLAAQHRTLHAADGRELTRLISPRLA